MERQISTILAPFAADLAQEIDPKNLREVFWDIVRALEMEWRPLREHAGGHERLVDTLELLLGENDE